MGKALYTPSEIERGFFNQNKKLQSIRHFPELRIITPSTHSYILVSDLVTSYSSYNFLTADKYILSFLFPFYGLQNKFCQVVGCLNTELLKSSHQWTGGGSYLDKFLFNETQNVDEAVAENILNSLLGTKVKSVIKNLAREDTRLPFLLKELSELNKTRN